MTTANQTTSVEQRRRQLYSRLCQLMDTQRPYIDEMLNRRSLATMLSTNHRYIEEAIRTCSFHPSTSSFINRYRLEYAARLLATTTYTITLIAFMSGFCNDGAIKG